jgi:hypothetical protein
VASRVLFKSCAIPTFAFCLKQSSIRPLDDTIRRFRRICGIAFKRGTPITLPPLEQVNSFGAPPFRDSPTNLRKCGFNNSNMWERVCPQSSVEGRDFFL